MEQTEPSSALAPPAAAAPVQIVVPEQVAPQLADLAEARGIVMRFLGRLDRVAEQMPPEELKQALAEDGTMILNLTRANRALRQIVAMEQEVLGLREPVAPRGFGPAGGGNGSGGDRRGRHDFNDRNDRNDRNDLNDLQELRELQAEFDASFDLTRPIECEAHDDFDAFLKFDSYDDWQRGRFKDPEVYAAFEEDLDDRLRAELERMGAFDPDRPQLPPEERRRRMKETEELVRVEGGKANAIAKIQWRTRHEQARRIHALERRTGRRNRGPPGG